MPRPEHDPRDLPSRRGDRRDYSAVERTTLSWIRTGIGVAGLGFVLARFSYVLQGLASIRGITVPDQSRWTIVIGSLHVVIGATIIGFALLRYLRIEPRVATGQPESPRLARVLVLGLTAGSVIGGAGLAIDLLLTWPR